MSRRLPDAAGDMRASSRVTARSDGRADEGNHDDHAAHSCRSSMTTSRCASRCPTCCGSSALPPQAFSSAEAFLASDVVGQTSCLILDVAMPGMSGPDLQQELTRRRQEIPIVFITASGDKSLRPRLLAAGRRRVPVQAVQRNRPARRAQCRASDEVSDGDDATATHHARRYTGRSATASGTIEVVTMPDITPIVFVVDDDVSVRESLELLISSAGWRAGDVRVGAGFPVSARASAFPCCLVLDVTLPGLNGLELQQQLAERTDMPIIFITGHGDVPMTVRAMKAGAVEFLTKPFKRRRAAGRDPAAPRAQSRRASSRGGDAGAAGLLCVAHAARARGDGAGRRRPAEQAGRRRARHQRDHGEGAPRPGDAQDEGRLAARPGDDGRAARPPAHADTLLAPAMSVATATRPGLLGPLQAATMPPSLAGRCLGARRAGAVRITPGEEGVQLRDDRGPLPDGRPHSLHRAATHVANGEDPLDAGLQR